MKPIEKKKTNRQTNIFYCPCGAMEAYLTSNQRVAGSNPVMDCFI